ncbi:MAG: glycosyltransferase family 39 protein [Alphaproteobacteria bacterium]|nr:glycosyltransferase family 39 protein [Alphaproteobacteria bacterium]
MVERRQWPRVDALAPSRFFLASDANAGELGLGQTATAFALFVIVWTLYATVAGAGHALHGDVVEAYAWGREFRLGYNQHPPFWAWIAGAWFHVFPTRDWAFHLLAVVNSALGLLGAWQLIGLFAGSWKRRTAFALLLLTPFYTFLSFKYNANTIFLSLWPWTLYAFCRAIDSRRLSAAGLFGLLAAASLLSKYYAAILLATCAAASLVHPERRRYYRSASPYISIAVCAVLCLPHALWLINTAAPTVKYVLGRSGIGIGETARSAAQLVGSELLYHAAIVALLAVAWWRSPRGVAPSVATPPWRRHFLWILVGCPVLLTVILGCAFELKLSSNMMVGCFPLLPLLLSETLPRIDARRLARDTQRLVVALNLAALAVSPLVAYLNFAYSSLPTASEPYREVAEAATRLWHRDVGRPLRIAGGAPPYDTMLAFYSPDHPQAFIDTDFLKSPWIAPERIETEGLLAVCELGDFPCHELFYFYGWPGTHHAFLPFAHEFWGIKRPPRLFDVIIIPPRPK